MNFKKYLQLILKVKNFLLCVQPTNKHCSITSENYFASLWQKKRFLSALKGLLVFNFLTTIRGRRDFSLKVYNIAQVTSQKKLKEKKKYAKKEAFTMDERKK